MDTKSGGCKVRRRLCDVGLQTNVENILDGKENSIVDTLKVKRRLAAIYKQRITRLDNKWWVEPGEDDDPRKYWGEKEPGENTDALDRPD